MLFIFYAFILLCLASIFWLWGLDFLSFCLLKYSAKELKIGADISVLDYGAGNIIKKTSRALVLQSNTGQNIYIPYHHILKKGHHSLAIKSSRHIPLKVTFPVKDLPTIEETLKSFFLLFPGFATREDLLIRKEWIEAQHTEATVEVVVPLLDAKDEWRLIHYAQSLASNKKVKVEPLYKPLS